MEESNSSGNKEGKKRIKVEVSKGMWILNLFIAGWTASPRIKTKLHHGKCEIT